MGSLQIDSPPARYGENVRAVVFHVNNLRAVHIYAFYTGEFYVAKECRGVLGFDFSLGSARGRSGCPKGTITSNG